MKAALLLGRNLAVCLPHFGREVEAEQGQRALPWRGGGGAFLVTSFHPKGMSQDRWPEAEMSVEPGVLCPWLEGWLSWSEVLVAYLQSFFRALKVNRQLHTFPNLGPNPGKKNNLKVKKCSTEWKCQLLPIRSFQQARVDAREVQVFGWWLLSLSQLFHYREIHT